MSGFGNATARERHVSMAVRKIKRPRNWFGLSPDTLKNHAGAVVLYGIAALAVSLNFSIVAGLTFFLFSAFVLFLYLRRSDGEAVITIKNWALAFPFVFLLITRLLPFFLYGDHPLGYDTGIYYFYATSPLVSFPNAPIKGFGPESIGSRVIIDFLRMLRVPPELILYGVYGASSLGAGLLIYLTVKNRFGKSAAFFSLFFYAVSMAQFTLYHAMLWKNMVALVFLLCFIYFLQREGTRRDAVYAFLFALLTVLTHRTTAIVLLLSLCAYLILNFRKSRARWGLWAQFVALSGVFLTLNRALAQYVFGHGARYVVEAERVDAAGLFPIGGGVFIEPVQYLTLSFALFPLALLGFCFLKERRHIACVIFGMSLFFLIFHLPFYKRMLVYADIAAIMLAGAACASIFQRFWHDRVYRRAAGVFAVALPVIAFLFAYNQKPLITERELAEIQNMQHTEAHATVITFSSSYGPWLYGFSKRNAIAPGLFADQWNQEQWQEFWFAKDRTTRSRMFSQLPRPLYVFAGEHATLAALPEDCLENFSSLVKKYICD